jgi:hypothetical protein
MSNHPLTYKPIKHGGLISAVSNLHPEDVLEWRKLRFREFGYVPYVADFLAHSRIDLHEMEDLLDAGCTHELATSILMGTSPFGEDPQWHYGRDTPDEEPSPERTGVTTA